MRTVKIVLLILAMYWPAATTITAGAVHSMAMKDFRHVREDLRECRKDLGFAWVWAMFPFTLPLSFAFTGGWQDGFRWDCDGAR